MTPTAKGTPTAKVAHLTAKDARTAKDAPTEKDARDARTADDDRTAEDARTAREADPPKEAPTTPEPLNGPSPSTGQGAPSLPPPPRAWRVVAVLVLAAAVLTGAAMTWSQIAQRAERHRQAYSDRITTLEVDADGGDVTVRAGHDSEVVVSDLVGWVIGRPTVAQEVTGETLKVAVECPGGRIVLGCAATVDIAVPAATKVRVVTSTGRAVVRGITGEVHAETEDGRVELEDLAGPLSLKTTTGQIDGAALTSPTAELVADSGQAALHFARPPVKVTARLASGPLVLGVPDDGSRYRIDFLSVDGRLDAAQGIEDASAPRVLDLSTASAPVTVTRTKAVPQADPSAAPQRQLTPPPDVAALPLP